jgi:hypothetical protein
VINFKVHIQTKLEGYENFVDEEVSREIEILKREEDGDNSKVEEDEPMEDAYPYAGDA